MHALNYHPTPRTVFAFTGLLAGIILAVTLFLLQYSSQKAATSQPSPATRDTINLIDKQWGFMPGVRKDKNSLIIEPSQLAIVEQDGTNPRPNPPLNLYGTHLEHADEFSMRAVVTDLHDTATLQLYSEAPIIADEFRIEAGSIRFTLARQSLKVAIWQKGAAAPGVEKQFVYTPASGITLETRFIGDALEVHVNGTLLAKLKTPTLFPKGNVWFGLDGTDTWRLTELGVRPIQGSRLSVVDSSTAQALSKDSRGLQLLVQAKRTDFTVGAAMALGPAATDPQYADIAFGGDFGGLTPENAMKWQAVHPTPDTYTFDYADALVDLAARHGLKVHGHALVFGEANPLWVNRLPTATVAERSHVARIMHDHITAMGHHFKGKLASIDVVNEPLADYDEFDAEAGAYLRDTVWRRAMGERYIADAFRQARTAFPGTLLVVNEYGLEEAGERWDTFLSLITRLKSQGVPIDAVGFQSHIYEPSDRIDPQTLRRHIRQLAAINVKSRISEIDVYAWGGQDNQADQYTSVFSACFEEPTCIAYTTWGISDRYNRYKDDDNKIASGEDFLWDASMRPTPAVDRLRSVLQP